MDALKYSRDQGMRVFNGVFAQQNTNQYRNERKIYLLRRMIKLSNISVTIAKPKKETVKCVTIELTALFP